MRRTECALPSSQSGMEELAQRPLFHMPVLSRYDFGMIRSPGPGLGNLLFPIARALDGQRRLGGTFVYPTILQLKLGTYLRRERDKRTYSDEFRRRTLPEWRQWLRAKLVRPKVAEGTASTWREPRTILYEGLGRCFHELPKDAARMRDWVDRNASYKGLLQCRYDVGVHVRLGDFQAGPDAGNGTATRQPMEWYQSAIQSARDLTSGRASRIVLFTDGDPTQVKQLLGISELEFDPSRNAVTAIRNLSSARCIVTSRSTFSMWSAYLGDAVALWHREFSKADIYPGRGDKDLLV
jgi:hypothetical protein